VLQYRLMAEDALIAGAAAPAGTRRIRSAPVLDSIWSLVVAAAIVLSSFFPLVDVDSPLFRTGEPPLRVYALGLPVLALIVVIAAVVRRSAVLAAVASGILVPSIALLGSLAGALFFDAGSPFTDAGTPLSLGCAAVGVIMLIRWFVYHTVPILGVEPRPTLLSARVLLGVGLALVANVVVDALRDDPRWSASFVVATMFMLLTPLVVVASAAVRTVAANALAAGAAWAQTVAVLVAMLDGEDLDITSVFTLRTGVVGVIALVAAGCVAVFGAVTAVVESDAVVDGASDDDTNWRWDVDDDL
jgi:hypothetical protein